MYDVIELAFEHIKNTTMRYFEEYVWNPMINYYKLTCFMLSAVIIIPLIVRLSIQ